MKMKKWKRVFSGILAAVTVLSTCIPGSVMASSEEVGVCYLTLEEIIDQLDEDEIVRPGDYTVPVGSDLDISLDFTNFNVTDWMKVNIYFDGAYNEDGEYFSTDHTDTYRANYHVEPVSGHPIYQVSRNVRVKEAEKPRKSTASNTGKASAGTSPSSSTASGGGDGGHGKSDSDKDGGDGSPDDDSHNKLNGADTSDLSGGDASTNISDESGGDSISAKTDSSGENTIPKSSDGSEKKNSSSDSDESPNPDADEYADANTDKHPDTYAYSEQRQGKSRKAFLR